MNEQTPTTRSASTEELPRPLAIREAMLSRADRRRRSRRFLQGTMTLACVLMVGATTWLIASPRHTSPDTPPRHASGVATGPVLSHNSQAFEVKQTRVIERAVTDDELVALLAEAGEPAGLATVNGETQLIRWDTAMQAEPPEPTDGGPSGFNQYPRHLFEPPALTTIQATLTDSVDATG